MATNPNMRRRRRRYDAARIAAVERQRQACVYRATGATYQQIATALGYRTRYGAWLAVQAALTRTAPKADDCAVELELQRMDALFSATYAMALRGDLTAIDAALAIMARRARLLGLDAPTKRENSFPGHTTAATVQRQPGHCPPLTHCKESTT